MKLKVIRKILSDKSTIGDLLIDDKFECFTLEDKVREIEGQAVSVWKVAGVTAISYGTYKLILDFSNRFKKIMPHVLDVPDFEGIRIHSGNTDVNTEGCLIVGNTKAVDFIGESKDAFSKLFTKLETAFNAKEEISIVYSKEEEVKEKAIEEKPEEVVKTPVVTASPVVTKTNIFWDLLQMILSLFTKKKV